MRLTEVAQSPGQRRDDANHRCCRPPGGPVVGIDLGDGLDEVGHSAQVHDSDDGHHDQGRHHHEPLNEVGVGHCQEPADERVDHRDGGDDDHAQVVVHPEGGLEEPSASHHAGGDVEGEVDQDDQSAGPTQEPACVVEAVVQEARDGDRVVSDLGVGAQAGSHQQPVRQGSDRQSDGDPSLDQAAGVQGARQPHEQPPRHVRGACRQRRDPGVEVAVGEHVVVEVVRSQVGPASDGEHGHEVNDHRNGLIGSVSHSYVLTSVSGKTYRGWLRATESGSPPFSCAGLISPCMHDDRDRVVAVMAQRNRPAPRGRYLLSEAEFNSAGNGVTQTQGWPPPSISDKLNLAPVDVLAQDNRRSAISATVGILRVRLAPGLDECLLGRPSGSQVLGRA